MRDLFPCCTMVKHIWSILGASSTPEGRLCTHINPLRAGLRCVLIENLKSKHCFFLVMKLSFKIGSAWGIPIELHLTFILLILGVLGLAIYYNQIYAFILIVFLFVFVLFHELAHSVVARRYDIKVRKIVLYPIGGVSEIEEIPENPKIEWRMAAAGPLTSLALGAALIGINYVLPVKIPMFQPVSVLLFSTGNILLGLGIPEPVAWSIQFYSSFPHGRRQSFQGVAG